MRFATSFIFAAVATLLASCTPHLGTRAERAASFAPFEKTKIAGQFAWDYVLYRSAWVVSAEGLDIRPAMPAPRRATARIRGHGRAMQFGTAAAIDARGYFLTAAHNLQSGQAPYIAFYNHGRVLFLPSRVAWRGNEKKGEADLALLHVRVPLDAVFPWAPAPQKGDPALSAGLDSGRRFKFQLVCLAGTVDRSVHYPKPVPGHTLIFHRTPLHPGDSGGAFVTPDGRLLGINTEIYPKNLFRLSPFTQFSAAQRLEPGEIQRLIAADLARPSIPTAPRLR